MSITKLSNLLNGNNILRMPMGAGDDAAGSFDPAAVAQAALENIKIQEKKFKLEKQIAEVVGNNLEAAKQQLEIERIRYGAAITALEEQKDKIAAAIAEGAKLQETIANTLENIELSVDQQAEMTKLMSDQNTTLDDVIAKIEEFRSKQEVTKDFTRDIASGTGTLARNMGIAANFSKTTAGKFVEMGQKFFNSDRAASGRAIAGAIDSMVNPMSLVASILDTAGKKMLEFNKAAIELKVATGFSNDFQREMTAVAHETSALGITIEKSNAAFAEITKSIKGVNLLGPDVRKTLGNAAAELTKIGVSAGTSAKGFNLLMKSFSMQAGAARKTFEGVVALGEDIGLTAEEMGTQFNSSMGYLTSFGKEGVQAFKDLAAQAGVTGVAIESLLNMTKAFDKFGEGAKKAATLNAVLGTSLSSMALMTMNPAERMKELRKQLKLVTNDGKNMTQAQKLFAKEAMGYASVAEMMADIQASPAQLAARAKAAEKQANIQKRMENAMSKLVPLADQLSMAFEKIATNKGLINVMSMLITALSFVAQNFEAALFVAGTLSTVYGVLVARTAFLTMKKIADGNATMMTNMYDSIRIALKLKEVDVTTKAGAAQMAYGRALLFTGGKLILFIGLVYLLYKAFTKKGSPMFYMMPLFIAGGVFLMARAFDTMGPMAILAAVALAILAAGIALVFYGMSALVESINGLFATMSESADTIPAVVIGIFGLATAFLFLGYAASLSSMGIFAGLGALTAMLLLFKLTGTSMATLFGAGDEIMKIGTGIEKFGQGLNNIRSAVGEIKSTLGSKGLFAGSVSGDSTSMIMGDGVAVAKLFKNSKIEVDVKMPEISIPKVDVKVFIGNEELRDIIRKEVSRNQR